MPPRLVSLLFQLSTSLLSRRSTDASGLLKVVGMTAILIDAESFALKNVRGRAWLGRIIKSLPNVSGNQRSDTIIVIDLADALI